MRASGSVAYANCRSQYTNVVSVERTRFTRNGFRVCFCGIASLDAMVHYLVFYLYTRHLSFLCMVVIRTAAPSPLVVCSILRGPLLSFRLVHRLVLASSGAV